MSAWDALVKKSFAANQGIRHGNPDVIKHDGPPHQQIGAKVGTLAWDYTNSDGYICTVAHATAATFVKINA